MPAVARGGVRRRYVNAAKHQASTSAAWLRKATPGLEGSLPRIVIIGGQRCGTTSLFQYLGSHPQIIPAHSKELNFFSLHHHRGLGWYRGCFPSLPEGMVTVEASPIYLIDPRVPERAAAALPDTHFVALVRNPTERAYSHYLHNLEHGLEPLSFADALDAEPERMRAARAAGLNTTRGVRLMRNVSYVHRGMYADHLQRWYDHVASERIHVLRFEDLFSNPRETYGRLLSDLELGPQPGLTFRKTNHWDDDPQTQLTPEVRARLDRDFAAANDRLQGMLSWQQTWPDSVR